MAKTTVAKAAQALKDNNGFVTTAASELGISREYLHRMINKHPTLKEAVTDAREAMKDFAESKIHQKISDGDTTMIIFFAKTQMKDRGYTEKQEIEQRTTNIDIDLSTLTDDQIKRLAVGEDIASILADGD